MKTYVLTVSNQFPKTHPRAGQDTGFVAAIKNLFGDHQTKIHTIRCNYPLWAKREKEINEGRAILSIRYWSGKPYGSKQIEICRLEKIGVQELVFRFGDFNMPKISNSDLLLPHEDLAKNDGLSPRDFCYWFKKYDFSKPMAIIHFTNFRY